MRISTANLFHPVVLLHNYGGVDDLVQFLHPRRHALARIAERGFRQLRTVYSAIGTQNSTAEAAHDLLINQFAGLHQFMRDPVRLDQVRAQTRKHLTDNGFS